MPHKRLRTLTRADLPTLPSWRVEHLDGGGLGAVLDAELRAQDAVWAATAIERYGIVGVQAVNDDHPDACLLVTPSLAVPSEHPAAASGRTPSACVVLALWTNPDYAAQGLARQVIGFLAGRVAGTASCLEMVAASRASSAEALLPSQALLSDVGFQTTPDPHPCGVVMRLDLDAGVREPRFGWALPQWLPWQGRPEPAGLHTADRRRGDQHQGAP